MQQEKDELNNNDVKKILTLSDRELRKYRKNGMPFTKKGRDYTYLKSQIIEWQKNRQENTASKLQVGKGYLNSEIEIILGCSGQGGMRRSHASGTLALFTDASDIKNPYHDRWINGILHYTGMGQTGDQKLEGNSNVVLAETLNGSLIAVHLFETYEVKQPKRPSKTFHRYIGLVEMVEKEYTEIENDRVVYKFPLQVVKGEKVYIELDLNNVQNESQRKINLLSEEEIKKRALLASERNELGNSKDKKDKKNYKRKDIVKTVVYHRDEYIAAYVKLLGKGKCQLCEQDAPFTDQYGSPYLECHHIIWLSEGGEDTIKNCVALCPNCHRKMHSLALKEDIKKLQFKVNSYVLW